MISELNECYSKLLSYEIWKLFIDGQTGKQWSEARCVDISFSCFYFPIDKWYGKEKVIVASDQRLSWAQSFGLDW